MAKVKAVMSVSIAVLISVNGQGNVQIVENGTAWLKPQMLACHIIIKARLSQLQIEQRLVYQVVLQRVTILVRIVQSCHLMQLV